jgi:hypothetical protein
MLGDHRDGEPAAGPLWYSLTLSSLLAKRQGNRTTFSASSFRSIPTGAFECIFAGKTSSEFIREVCQNAFYAGIEAVQEALVLGSASGAP